MLSFDVEDWFQVENLASAVRRDSWDKKELRVEKNTKVLLEILDSYDCKATFFVLGWVAEKVPGLVSEIEDRGHEVASHGHGHELVTNISVKEFEDDLEKSRNVLQEITGSEVLGYRAPNYSITEDALDVLRNQGFKYDSSYFPSSMHDRYAKLDSINDPKRAIVRVRKDLLEVMIPTWGKLGLNFPWGGGGYFRALPYSIFKFGVNRLLQSQGSFVFYLHPWEIDADQPRLKNIKRSYQFRHYVGLNSAEAKLEKLLNDFDFVSIETGLRRMGYL